MSRLKLIQSELSFTPVEKPRQIVTESSKQFFDLCDRAKTGALVIEAVAVGQTNGQWVFAVRWE